MEIIFCRGCGREIHESAQSCPGCGAVMNIVAQGSSNDKSPFMCYIEAWKEAFNFRGRIRRREYWFFFLFHCIAIVIFSIIGGALRDKQLLVNIYSIIAIMPNISMGIRRMHDTNRCGWWILLPIVNLIFLVQDSYRAANKYGSNPKSNRSL